MKKSDTTVEDALRTRTFDSLAIKRIARECYLVVTISKPPASLQTATVTG
jgi:hypothetical protein